MTIIFVYVTISTFFTLPCIWCKDPQIPILQKFVDQKKAAWSRSTLHPKNERGRNYSIEALFIRHDCNTVYSINLRDSLSQVI